MKKMDLQACRLFLLAAFASLLATLPAAAAVLDMEVSAGANPRKDTPVSVEVPDGSWSMSLLPPR